MKSQTSSRAVHQNEWHLLINQFSVEQLSRCLIREFFVQNKLPKTLQTFELEDTQHKKINKSNLIKILSMNNLVYNNKHSARPFKSLLEVLVSYLSNKVKDKLQSKRSQIKTKASKNEKMDTYSESQNQRRDLEPEEPKPDSYYDDYDNEWEKQQVKDSKSNNHYLSNSLENKFQEEKRLSQTAELKANKDNKVQFVQGPVVKTNVLQNKIECIDIQFNDEMTNNKADHNYKVEVNQKKNTEETIKDNKNATNQQSKPMEEQVKVKKEQNRQQQVRPQSAITNKNENTGGSRMMGMKRFGKKKQETPQLKIQSKQIQQEPSKASPTKNQQIKQQPIKEKAIEEPSKKPETVQKGKNQQQNQGPKMVKMFGKKKRNQEKQPQAQPTKFKFDDNFVDQPLNAQVEKYQYQRLDMFNITLQSDIKAFRVKYQDKIVSKRMGEKQRLITEQQATLLKKAIFQGGNSVLPKAWHQGFILSPFKQTPYGLKQIEGGPCGIIAAVQCYYLKHYLYLAGIKQKESNNETLRDNCLIAAITDMLYKVRNQENKIILSLPPKGFAASKIDYNSLKIYTIDASSFESAFESLVGYRSYFIGNNNHGVTVLMICMIMTKGIQKIKQEIDMPEAPLIGNHGHCTQELVNLFITGMATSNCFDGQKIIDDDMKIKGIKEKCEFGFLTIFETLNYIEVGKNLKNPIYPFWIICKEFHYHVIFANHYLVAENNDAQKFDIVYFDGLYNCGDKIMITLEKYAFGEEPKVKDKDLPLIEQVMMTKWGLRKSDWNGSIPIL